MTSASWWTSAAGRRWPTRCTSRCRPPANILTRAYHLYALPANRLRVATDWFNDIIEHRQFVRLGLIPGEYSGLTAAEHTDIYYQTDGQPLNHSQVPQHPQGTAVTDGGIRVV